MNAPDYPEWTRKARSLLDASTRNLDAATLSRLNRSRQAALTQRHRLTARRWLVPTGLASACALLLTLGVWRTHLPHHFAAATDTGSQTIGSFQADDMEMVDGDDSLDLYQNLDFYAWLDTQDRDGDG
ncbi:MAG: hypothetical protein WBV39_05475 [Rudaea sp.]